MPAAEAALQEVAASAQQWPEQLKQLMDVVMGRTVPEAAVLLVEVDAAGKGTEQTLRDVSWNALVSCAFCDCGGSKPACPGGWLVLARALSSAQAAACTVVQ